MHGIAIKSILSSRQQRVTESSFCCWLLMTVSHKIIILHQSGPNSTQLSAVLSLSLIRLSITLHTHRPRPTCLTCPSIRISHIHTFPQYNMHGIQPSQPASQPVIQSTARHPSRDSVYGVSLVIIIILRGTTTVSTTTTANQRWMTYGASSAEAAAVEQMNSGASGWAPGIVTTRSRLTT